jgi:hypothetical protein
MVILNLCVLLMGVVVIDAISIPATVDRFAKMLLIVLESNVQTAPPVAPFIILVSSPKNKGDFSVNFRSSLRGKRK